MADAHVGRGLTQPAAGKGAVCAVALAGVATAPVFGLTTLASAGAVAGVLGELVWPPLGRRSAAAIAGTAGVVSLLASVGVLWFGDEQGDTTGSGGWAPVEVAALLILIVVAVRVASAYQALVAGVLAGAAVPAVWMLRFQPLGRSGVVVLGFGFWWLVAAAAAAVGFYLRSLDAERARSVAAARQAQRLHLARDLHDFVAHDVSEMLAQAQAGQFLTGRGPLQATDAFRRIEQAGLHALASLDRTVWMLHDDTDLATWDTADRAPLPALADLPELADRFSASGPAVVQLTIDAELTERDSAVPREVATTVYRIVVEALTNVRRHAPTASLVQVDVCRTQATAGLVGPALAVTVTDDARTVRAPGAHARGPLARSSGLGLSSLAERIHALGGTLTAGPREEMGAADPPYRPGWCVTAVLPLTSRSPAETPA